MNWCTTQLQSQGFNPLNPISNTVPYNQQNSCFTVYRTVYLELHTAINLHINTGQYPQLSLTIKPVGAHNWKPTESVQNGGGIMEQEFLAS